VYLTSFSNDASLTADGTRCVGTTAAANGTGLSSCRTFFHVCLTNYQPSELLGESTSCQYAEGLSAVVSNNSSFDFPAPAAGDFPSAVGAANEVEMTFSFAWPVRMVPNN
jgi:hypothetical protein